MSALENTVLAHHEPGNEYCPYCDRLDLIFPVPCHCGGLIHRQGDSDAQGCDRYVEICDQCGKNNDEDEIL